MTASQIGTALIGSVVWKSWNLDALRFIYGTIQNGYKIVIYEEIPSLDYQVQNNYGTSQAIYSAMQNGYKILVFGEILSHDYQVQYNYGTSQVLSPLG